MGSHDIIKFDLNVIKRVGNSIALTDKLLALEAGKIKILIANDHTLFIWGVKKGLEIYSNIDFIGEAYSFEDIFLKMENLIPDILITDDQMPRTDFLNDILKIKELYPNLKIIVNSLGAYDDKISEYIQYVNGYISFTADAVNYYEAFKKVYEGGNYFIGHDYSKVKSGELRITNNKEEFVSLIKEKLRKYASK